MKHNTHRPAEYFIRVPLACCFFITGCLLCFSGAVQLYPFRGLPVFTLSLLSIMFGICSFASFRLSILNLATHIRLDDGGMYIERFGKTLNYLPWGDIRFAGVCIKASYRGKQKRYCFSDRRLSAEERANITAAGGRNIYFSAVNPRVLDYIRERSPIKPGSEIEQFM